MKLNFLESGLDSLKKGFQSLTEYENILFQSAKKGKERFFYLKDAILFIQHGIEILFKQLLSRHSEYLLFSQIDDNVKKALKEKNDRKLQSVFESELKHKLHTVTFQESLERIKIIPGVSISGSFEKKLKQIEVYRNIIMHSEPHLNESDINSTFDGLADEIDIFFAETIGGKHKTISGYSEWVKSFEKYQHKLKENKNELKLRTNEIVLASLNAARIRIGQNEVKRITDINKCTKFLDVISSSDLDLGTDLYNGYCSGEVKEIRRKGEHIFSMYTADNDCYFEFSLRSIILFMPDADTDASPIIFIESDEIAEDEYYPASCSDLYEWNGIRQLKYAKQKNGSRIYLGEKQLNEYYEDSNRVPEEFDDFVRFYTKGIFCFLNVQGLNYNGNHAQVIEKFKFMDGKEFEVSLRQAIPNLY